MAFHWRAITLVAASPLNVRCRHGTFAPFPTQLVLHSENHTFGQRRRSFGSTEDCWRQELGFWKDTMLLEMMRNTSNRIGHDDEDVDKRSHNRLMKASRPKAWSQAVNFHWCRDCFIESLGVADIHLGIVTSCLQQLRCPGLPSEKVCLPGSCMSSDGSSRLRESSLPSDSCLRQPHSHTVNNLARYSLSRIIDSNHHYHITPCHEQLNNNDLAQSESPSPIALRSRTNLSPYHEPFKYRDSASLDSISRSATTQTPLYHDVAPQCHREYGRLFIAFTGRLSAIPW